MICVFLGPSIALAEARTLVDADFQPPAAMGDVLRTVTRGAKAIAIIDGVFERVPSIWHKEILFALSQGIPVYGSSSMGALRAAECHSFGMIGVGQVFEAFRDGVLEDDDEVAVAHAAAEHGYRCLSDAMVNIRQAVREATARGLLSTESAARLVREAKARFYPDRHWGDLVRSASALHEEESRQLLVNLPTPPDVKRADARLLLTELGRLAQSGIPRHVPSFDLEATTYWQATVAKECPVVSGSDQGPLSVNRWKLSGHLRLVRSDRRELSREALFDLLVAAASSRIGALPGSFVPTYAACANVDELRSRLDQAADALARRLRGQLEPFLAVALARRGELHAELTRAAGKWTRVADRGLEWPQLADIGVDIQTLSDWYEAKFASLEDGGEAHAKTLGFDSWEEFIGELVAEFLSHAETS
jgi:hypothetical protein